MDSFDYVVVGAGSAGCVVAARLAERGFSVCVLEAGPMDRNPFIRIPAGVIRTTQNAGITWRFQHQGGPDINNRTIPFIQGRVVGGSGSLNGMMYNRGKRSDFDLWAAAGNSGWDYESILPYFRKTETYLGGGSDGDRGRAGPIRVTQIKPRFPVIDSFLRAAEEQGAVRVEDYNDGNQAGVAIAQANIHRGRRSSPADVYLHPARRRHDIRLLASAMADRLVIEGRRVRGVAYRRPDGERGRVSARRATILCCGSVNSPKLLQLSGVGPADRLKALGISPVLDLPGVGENLRDHFTARIVARARAGIETVNAHVRGLPLLWEGLRWLAGKPSVLAMPVVAAYAFYRSRPEANETDYLVNFLPASLKGGQTRVLEREPGVTASVWQLRPDSHGRISLRSADPDAAPLIEPNYLSEESDRRVMVTGLRKARAILATAAMREVVDSFVMPAQECRTDDEWLGYLRQYGMSVFHLVGTCKMGPASDPLAVVGPGLRLHGLDGLYVVDASIMPTTPSGNSHAAVLMIGEKGADQILADRAVGS